MLTVEQEDCLAQIPDEDLFHYVRETCVASDVFPVSTIERDFQARLVDSDLLSRLQKQLDRFKHKQAFTSWDAAEELEKLMDICEDLVR